MPACVISSDSVGDMVGLVPAADTAASLALAKPKSSSFTTPSGVTLILAGFQAGGDLPRVIHSRLHRHRTLQVLTFDQLHHDGSLLDAVDSSDIGMVQRGQHLRFAL